MTNLSGTIRSKSDDTYTQKSSNTGLLIGLVIVGIIAIVALILSILPLFQGDDNKDDSNGNAECPKSGCDIDAKSIKATTITAGDITATGTIEYESLEATTSKILNLTTTNISNTSGVFTDTLRSRRIDNTSLISSTFINATELTLFSILSQPGVRVDNGGSVSPKNITLNVNNYFYSVQIFPTSSNNIQLNLNLSDLRNGQSMFINCWAARTTSTNEAKVNLVINRPSGSTLNVVNTTTASSAFSSGTSTTTGDINIFVRPGDSADNLFVNYLAYFTDGTLYIMLISKN